MSNDRHTYWNDVYERNAETAVSWFQDTPATSLSLIRQTGLGPSASVIDVGGGASRLVDCLVNDGYSDVTILDLSEAALSAARARLGTAAGSTVHWIVADVTSWRPQRRFDIWHDRAAF